MVNNILKAITDPVKAIKIVLGIITRKLSGVPFLWRYFMFKKIGFKFKAFKFGISQNKRKKNVYFNLRRNIHRLEKGLSYKNRKKIFAESYIYETVEYLSILFSNPNLDSSTRIWAVSVLNEYFKVVDAENLILQKSLLKYEKLIIDSSKSYDHIPYSEEERVNSTIDYGELYKLALQRRSVRFFKEIPVSTESISKVFEIAKLSPSACNRQSFRFLFFNDSEVVEKISAVPGGVSGYKLYNIVIVIGDYSGYFDERDINVPIIDASLASMSLLFACETVGLSTVCINWPNLPDREKAIRKLITIKKSEFIIMMIGIGYAANSGKILYSTKRDNQDFLLLNKRIKKQTLQVASNTNSLCD